MSADPARSCPATARPKRRMRPAVRWAIASSAARNTHGIQAAPARWIHRDPRERNGPLAAQTAAPTKAPALATSHRRRRAEGPQAEAAAGETKEREWNTPGGMTRPSQGKGERT